MNLRFLFTGHTGAHRWDEYRDNWNDLDQVMTSRIGNEDINPRRTIYTNYHYAGHKYWDPDQDPEKWQPRSFVDGHNSILLADGMRRSSDLNFNGGVNVLPWTSPWNGEDWKLANVLPADGQDTIGTGGEVAQILWDIFRALIMFFITRQGRHHVVA